MPTTTPLTREEVREAILDAVDRLLARYGYRKMTMDDIAQEVGIGKGTIYLHFASKEEVTLSHVDRIVERLKERLWAIARSEAAAGVRLRLMLLTRVLFRFDSVQHYTQSLNDLLAAVRPTLLARRARYFEEEARVFANKVEHIAIVAYKAFCYIVCVCFFFAVRHFFLFCSFMS